MEFAQGGEIHFNGRVAKTVLIRLTEILAAEVALNGVRAFAIKPGTVRTAMAESALEGEAGRRWMP